MNGWFSDIRHGLRSLVKDPGFAAPCFLVLALAIGANTAIFSLVNQVLLQPLPFFESDRLVRLHQTHPAWGDRLAVSMPTYRDWRELRGAVFEEVGTYSETTATLRGGDRPERIAAAAVTTSVFTLLGVLPQTGRFPTEADEAMGAPMAVVISDRLWGRLFGGDPGILGKTVGLDDRDAVVVGVAPAGFRFPLSGSTAPVELWTVLADDPDLGRDRLFLQVLARLKEGVSLEQARMSLFDQAQRRPIDELEEDRFGVAAVAWKEELVGDARPALWLFMGAVGLVLLTACVNLGNLGLSRGERRRRELAIRSALGAGRWRLGRQLLIESVLCGLAGGAAGFLLAHAVTRIFADLRPPELAPWANVTPDIRAFLFTSAISLLSGILIGLAPALTYLGGDLAAALKEGIRGGRGTSRLPVRHTLAAVQVAFAVALVAGAALLIQSFWRLSGVDVGFDPDRVLTARVWLDEKADEGRQRRFYQGLLDQAAHLPGVDSAGAIQTVPLGPGHWQSFLAVEGREFPEDAPPVADFRIVAGDYFRAMGVPVLLGRDFGAKDREGAAPVAIVNQALARRFWPGEDPVGKRIAATGAEGPDLWASVVGVVKDVTHSGLADQERPAVYRPFNQHPVSAMDLVVSGSAQPLELLPALQSAVWEIDRDVPALQGVAMDQLVAASSSEARYRAWLMGVFAALALALGLLGCYSVTARSVADAGHEIGIRLALGAQRGEILRLFLGRGARAAGLGVAVGLLGALLLGGALQTLLFGVSGRDGATFLSVGGLMAAAVLLACYLPSRRASRMDPAAVLRRL